MTEVRSTSSTGAMKGVKPERFDLVPFGVVREIATGYGKLVVDFPTDDWRPALNTAVDNLAEFWSNPFAETSHGVNPVVVAAMAVMHLVEHGLTELLPMPTPGPRRGGTISERTEQRGPRYDLIPTKALTALALHYGRGAEKYALHNWAAGYEYSKSFAALNRHLWAAIGGEHVDEELGSPHLVAVSWHCCSLIEFTTTHPGFDDRPVRGTNKTVDMLSMKDE